jgi:hypothetical protein
MQQHHVVQELLQSLGGGQAKHAHPSPHIDTYYNQGYKHHISKYEIETQKI